MVNGPFAMSINSYIWRIFIFIFEIMCKVSTSFTIPLIKMRITIDSNGTMGHLFSEITH